ncbi:glycoside hydrolase family 6 protein [Cellulomonas endophytica]|uniref:glycoside hydrolase family 6 protein n=1 Tax=Cellulomonas endophytica TaxID=2494735 RepID=UPI00196B09AC|nr:glycoside hydrolase family 6 protein [Cellulomonas endophytica]
MAGLLAAGLLLAAAAPAAAEDVLDPGTDLSVDPASTTLEAAASLTGQARADAELLASFPTATWFTDGSPGQVKNEVRTVVADAARRGEVPVLVAYNLPYRDCAQYSAGGARGVDQYKAWVRQLAHGIGDREAVVVLEPDGLGIIPWYTTLDGQTEWCRPSTVDAATAADQRFEMLGYAVDVLGANARTAVYLDATHSGWLSVEEATSRLLRAGVERADGFFLNVSNYEYTQNNVAYGTWVSSCLAYVTQVAPGGYGECGDQFWSGGPANGWTGVALSSAGRWSDTAADPALSTAGLTSRYAALLGDVEPTTHFVVDTSRNGRGPWVPDQVLPDPEVWCNPPDRGLGDRPTTSTGHALVDAFLWIKVPGESDGRCLRGTAGPQDPVRGIVDPAAGRWFPQQARELVALAVPAL